VASENDQHSEYIELSLGAITLLKAARVNDRLGTGQLTSNAALRLSLEVLPELVSACASNDTPMVCNLIGRPGLPDDFLSFVASLANRIDLNIRRRQDADSGSGESWSATSDFDHNVFLALGQTIGQVVWPNPQKRDVRAPVIARVLERLAACSGKDLRISLIQHYVANLFQEYFDRAQVRVNVPGLPENTEAELRNSDARVIAGLAYRKAGELSGSGDTLTAAELQAGLEWTIDAILSNKP
jgi:hypothetical protein